MEVCGVGIAVSLDSRMWRHLVGCGDAQSDVYINIKLPHSVVGTSGRVAGVGQRSRPVVLAAEGGWVRLGRAAQRLFLLKKGVWREGHNKTPQRSGCRTSAQVAHRCVNYGRRLSVATA